MLIHSSVNYIYHVVHHTSSSHSSCNWESMLLTAFIQFPLPRNPLPLVTTNLISFPEFACFQYIIDLQQCISSLVHYQHSDWVFLYISKLPPSYIIFLLWSLWEKQTIQRVTKSNDLHGRLHTPQWHQSSTREVTFVCTHACGHAYV